MRKKYFTHIKKRDGSVVPFTDIRITNAVYKAAIAVGGRDLVQAKSIASKVIDHLMRELDEDVIPEVEKIQEAIEKVLIESGHALTAKAFILYRSERQRERDSRALRSNTNKNNTLIPWRKVLESINWSIDHHTLTVEQLNRRVEEGSYMDLVRESEERYNLDIVCAADRIIHKKETNRIVIVAGPSSSGKTTTTKKIAALLKKEEIELIPFHVDDYYFDLELHPKDEKGDYDYESPQAIDLALLNEHLLLLLQEKEIRVPDFNFVSGKREGYKPPFRLEKGQVLLIDSLHGMFPPMTEGIPDAAKTAIYIEPLLQMRTVDGSYIKWTDIRLMRRMVRDRRERNKEPENTLRHWPYVRRAELQYIMPRIQNADYVIDSSLPYELPVYSSLVGSIFNEWVFTKSSVLKDDPIALNRATRIANLLKNIIPTEELESIPASSLIREFIGGLEL